jgi:xylulokinase
MYLLGFDVGSSSIKAALLESEGQEVIATAAAPEKEMAIEAVRGGWAEQRPEVWWENVKVATGKILSIAKVDPGEIKAIGISYQMHGLVVVDKDKRALRPAIIWCDSRAVEIGNRASEAIGPSVCLERLLNFPGNFTASKLKWVKENEPEVYGKIYKAMLPGDYIAMRMSDRIVTTASGLSEGILWDFQEQGLAGVVLEQYGIDADLIPAAAGTFSEQGELTKAAAAELGLKAGTKIAYRAGDQPNNAFSLMVLNPGEIAATAGTSGVVYGVGDKPRYDSLSRVNTFVHVNSTSAAPRYGVLLCVNGTGILNSWLKHNVGAGMDYTQMNELAERAPAGCEGLVILPYGNGAERTLENRDIGAVISGLNFNRHGKGHLLRAGQEGIVFALNYGLKIMREMGIEVKTVRAGEANMFLSGLFGQTFATVSGAVVELYHTDGAQGAARGAGVGAGVYRNYEQAFEGLRCARVIEPDEQDKEVYEGAYGKWLNILNKQKER